VLESRRPSLRGTRQNFVGQRFYRDEESNYCGRRRRDVLGGHRDVAMDTREEMRRRRRRLAIDTTPVVVPVVS